jgi:lipopolysaccharide export system permease protein
VKYQSTLAEVVRFYIARLPVLASRVVPMALLLAASLTMSLLIVRGELVGIWACGVSTLRTVRSILATCVLLAVSYHGLNNELVPRASARASYLKQTEIKNRAPGAVRSSLWYRVGSQLYVAGSLDPLAGEAHDITIYELDSDWLPRSRTDATLAHHVGHGVWRLEAPTRVEVADGSPRTAEAGPFAELGKEVPADVDSSHLTIGDLRRAIQDVESSGYDATSYRVDFQQKLASPLACLVLPLLGLIVATAGPPFWTPAQSLLVCVLEGVGYLALSGIAASLGYGRFLPPPVAGFAPLALMSGAAGVVALRRGLRS